MTWLKVINAVLELAGDKAQLVAQTDAPWRSATFSGWRHTVTLRFQGEEAIVIGEAFIAELGCFPDLPGKKVVEAKTTWTRRVLDPAELAVQVELLLLDEEKTAA